MKEYSKNYQDALHDLWLHFVRGEEADYSVVRPDHVVLSSEMKIIVQQDEEV